MYASIQRYDRVTAAVEEVIPAGRQAAAALQRLPGFVAYVLLDAGDGLFMAISLFEDETGLQAAEGLWALNQRVVSEGVRSAAGQPSTMSGEVVVQTGL